MENNTIQRVIEIPISELQNDDAQQNWEHYNENQCSLCGKKLGKKIQWIQYLTNGNIISTSEDVENSQGFFPVGSECAKKLVIQFSFK